MEVNLKGMGGNMVDFILLIVVLVVWGISRSNTNRKLDNYDMSKVSIGKMSMDSGKSKAEIRRNLVAGKYDKDDKWKI